MKSASPTDRPTTRANRRAAFRARHRRAAISAAASAVVCGQQSPNCTPTTPNCRPKISNGFHHRNQQYSVIALTDGSGAIAERYAYSAYGEPVFTNSSGTVLADSAKDNRYTYTGREWDEKLNLYHFRARMYDPESGRFCGRDPKHYVDGSILYMSHLMLAFLDPTGMAKISRPCEESDDDECMAKCRRVKGAPGEAEYCYRSVYRFCGVTFGWGKQADCKCAPRRGPDDGIDENDDGGGICELVDNELPYPPARTCFRCTYDCRGTRYFGTFQRIIRYQPNGCHGERKWVWGYGKEKDCRERNTGYYGDPLHGLEQGEIPWEYVFGKSKIL